MSTNTNLTDFGLKENNKPTFESIFYIHEENNWALVYIILIHGIELALTLYVNPKQKK